MKSTRFALLKCLQIHGEQTLDDLETQLSELKRDKIYSNLQAAKSDQFVSARPDVVTRRPAYKLTEKGKEWLAGKGISTVDDVQATPNTDTSTPISSEPDVPALTAAPESEVPVIGINIVGPVGIGKTLVASMIDQMLSAHDVQVEFESEDEANEARTQPYGELNPISGKVRIQVEHDSHPVCCGAARVIATTAAEVSGEYRAQLDELTAQNRLLTAENSALRQHSVMLGEISNVVERFDKLGDDTTLGVVTTMAQMIDSLQDSVNESIDTVRRQAEQASKDKARIAVLESNGDLLTEAAKVSAPVVIAAGKPPFYVSIGRDTGPQIHKEIGPATRRMKSIVRRGDKVGLVLVPILKAVPGVELVEVKAA